MNIRKRYTKVCLFLWVIGMCLCTHPINAQSVIPVPLKMEQGTGSFLLSEKTKLYTNLQGEEAILLGNYLKTALPVQFKEECLVFIDNRKEASVGVTGKLYIIRYS